MRRRMRAEPLATGPRASAAAPARPPPRTGAPSSAESAATLWPSGPTRHLLRDLGRARRRAAASERLAHAGERARAARRARGRRAARAAPRRCAPGRRPPGAARARSARPRSGSAWCRTARAPGAGSGPRGEAVHARRHHHRRAEQRDLERRRCRASRARRRRRAIASCVRPSMTVRSSSDGQPRRARCPRRWRSSRSTAPPRRRRPRAGRARAARRAAASWSGSVVRTSLRRLPGSSSTTRALRGEAERAARGCAVAARGHAGAAGPRADGRRSPPRRPVPA